MLCQSADEAWSSPWVAPASAADALSEALRAAGRSLRAVARAMDDMGAKVPAELVVAAACTIDAAIAVSAVTPAVAVAGATQAVAGPRRRLRRRRGRGGTRSEPEIFCLFQDDDLSVVHCFDGVVTDNSASDFESRQQFRAVGIVSDQKANEIVSSGAASGSADEHLPAALLQKPARAPLRADSSSQNQMRVAASLSTILAPDVSSDIDSTSIDDGGPRRFIGPIHWLYDDYHAAIIELYSSLGLELDLTSDRFTAARTAVWPLAISRF